jgi:hypothetical protein
LITLDVAALSQYFLTEHVAVIGRDEHPSLSPIAENTEFVLGQINHLMFQVWRTKFRMDGREGFVHAKRMEYSAQAAGGRFPKKHDLINRWTELEILDEMRMPVIESGNMSAQLMPVVK